MMGFSSGPPTSVCGTLLPNHGGSPSAGNGGYLITTSIPLNSNIGYDYVAGQSYTGRLLDTSEGKKSLLFELSLLLHFSYSDCC